MAKNLVFIDDSGDPGMKLGKGSSNFFSIAAVLFQDDLDAEETSLKIRRLRRELGWKSLHEFKFRKTSPEIRKRFLVAMRNQHFVISLVNLDKRSLSDGGYYKKNPIRLYNETILKAIRGFDANLADIHVYIDGESGRDYRRNVKTMFRKELPKGVIKELSYRDSRDDNLIQLADMIAGAARRSVDGDKDGSYIKIMRKKILYITDSL